MCSNTLKYKSLGFIFICVLLAAACSKKDSINGPSDEPGTASVDLANTHQVIRGFGAANILPLRPDMTVDQVNTAFGTGAGQLGFTILRLRVPPDTSQFVIQVATAQLAHAQGVTIIASPWTPPASMKTNNTIIGGELKTDSYAAYAAHLKAFADYMASNGVPLYAISVQNEPDISVSYESCSWNALQILAFVKNNAPAIGTKIIVPESFNFDHTISDAVLNDPIAASNVSIIGGHIYGEGFKGFLWSLYQSIVAGGHIFGGGRTSYPFAVSKGKEVWMTEHLDKDTSGSAILGTAREIHDCMNAGMSAYIWWYIVRYYGPILENGNISKRGYVMSQYARFIRPGYARVHATANPQPDVYVTAYKNSSKVTIVAINSNGSFIDQTFTVRNGTVSRFIPYVTSSTKNCIQGNTVSVSNGSFTATLEPSSVTTFVSN